MAQRNSVTQQEIKEQFDSFSVSSRSIEAFLRCCVQANDANRAADKNYIDLLIKAGKKIVENQPVGDRYSLKRLCLELNEALNLDIQTTKLDPLWLSLLRLFRTMGSGLLFLFVSYFVIGGIWSNQSSLSEEFSRLIIYIALGIFILILAVLEGTQLSVTMLKFKDLESIKLQFPRSYKLHKLFKTTAGTKKYLAGRQMMVIVVVFFIAQLISFPEMHNWPLTHQPFPSFFYPWIHLLFLKLGILGAIFVLWFGQLIPQFLAASNPQRFLNWPGMGWVVKGAWLAESIGITQPVDWLTRNANHGDKIPPSNKEIYFETSENIGFSVLSLTKEIVVKYQYATVATQNYIQILDNTIDVVVDESITFIAHNLIESYDETTVQLIRHGRALESNSLSLHFTDRLKNENGITTRIIRIKPDAGLFERGDILKIDNTMRFTNCEVADISMKLPTRYTQVSVQVEGKSAEMKVNSPSMIFHEWDAIGNNFLAKREEQLALDVSKQEDVLRFEKTLLFPQQFTKHTYSWVASYPLKPQG